MYYSVLHVVSQWPESVLSFVQVITVAVPMGFCENCAQKKRLLQLQHWPNSPNHVK